MSHDWCPPLRVGYIKVVSMGLLLCNHGPKPECLACKTSFNDDHKCSNHWDVFHLAFKGDVTSNVKLPLLMVHSVTNHLACICNDCFHRCIVKFDQFYKVSMGWASNGAITSYPSTFRLLTHDAA